MNGDDNITIQPVNRHKRNMARTLGEPSQSWRFYLNKLFYRNGKFGRDTKATQNTFNACLERILLILHVHNIKHQKNMLLVILVRVLLRNLLQKLQLQLKCIIPSKHITKPCDLCFHWHLSAGITEIKIVIAANFSLKQIQQSQNFNRS